MRVGVIGGAGFVGSHLVDELLERGHEVDVFDDRSSCWINDEGDPKFVNVAANDVPGLGILHECEILIDVALRHPLERELPLYRLALDRAYTTTGIVLNELPARTLKRVVVAGALEALDPECGTPLARHLRAYEEGLGYLHRPPHFDVEFVHLPELYGPRQLPDAGWVAALLTDSTMTTTESFCNLGYVRDAAHLLADRVEVQRSRKPTSFVVTAPATSKDDVLAAITSMRFEEGDLAAVEARARTFGEVRTFRRSAADFSLDRTSLDVGLAETIRFYEETNDE